MGNFHGLYLWVALTHGHIFSWNMGWQLLRAPRMELLCGGREMPGNLGQVPSCLVSRCAPSTLAQLSAYPTAAPDHSLKSVSCHVIHFGLICLSWLKSFHFIYSGTPQAGQGYLETNLSILPCPHPESAENRKEWYAMFYRCVIGTASSSLFPEPPISLVVSTYC